jgi:uncharacterized protein YndB with AHSA1/START domain
MSELLVMTRVFEAPPEVVFEQWLEPEHLARWWTASRPWSRAIEVRPGDAFRFRRLAPDGTEYWLRVELHEIVRPERIVFVWGGDEVETRTIISVTFAAERDGKTRVALCQSVATGPDHRRHVAA